MIITAEQFSSLFPSAINQSSWVKALNSVLPRYSIDTKLRVCAFLAQCGHESAGFTALSENLNYREETLLKIFPKYFPNQNVAALYAKNPAKIANRVYANRMGNGDEASGDGYNFRGRGLIQLTGKNNYTEFANKLGKTLSETVNYCETQEGAIESACFFWTKNNLNTYADFGSMTELTKRINGGINGLDDRIKRYNDALNTIQ